MMIQMLVHHSRPLPRGHRSEKAVRILRASLGPTCSEAVDQFTQSLPLYHEVPFILYYEVLVRRHTTAKRLLVQKSRFHEPPNHTPNQTSWQTSQPHRHLHQYGAMRQRLCRIHCAPQPFGIRSELHHPLLHLFHSRCFKEIFHARCYPFFWIFVISSCTAERQIEF